MTLGKIKFYSDRWQNYAGKFSMCLNMYTAIIVSTLKFSNGIGLWLLVGAVVLLVLSILFVVFIDCKYVYPNESKFGLDNNPSWNELVVDVKEIKRKCG